MDKLPDDILKAQKLFSEFEKLSPKMKVQKFEKKFFEAIKLLDNHIKENPHSPHFKIISNLKKSNTRSLLNHLNELHFDYVNWVWARVCIKVCGDILNQIFIKNPELEEEYKKFVRLYSGYSKEIGI